MAKDTFLNRKTTVNIKGKLLDLSSPSVMGILNLTDDSFYSASRVGSIDGALRTVEKFLTEGARFIDVGAYSSRPGAADVSQEQEIQRLLPVIEAIKKSFPQALLSVDTFRAKVAEGAIQSGADIINDIAGGEMDDAMFDTVARLKVPYIMMHMKGIPKTMQQHAHYENIVLEIVDYFSAKVTKLRELGVKDIILDPGFGFAKTIEHNYQLMDKLEDLQVFELPLLIGISRKSMIYKLLGTTPSDSLNGTTILNTIALLKGANILRVHDVKEAAECVMLIEKLQQQHN